MNPDPKSVSPSSGDRSQLDPSPSPNLDATQLFSPGESHQELADLLDEYLAELQAGRRPDQQQFLSKHPHLATQLKSCLSGIEFIHRAALPTSVAGMPTQLGDFRIIREVGHGGMGVVYEAEQISLKRRVALKVLRYGAAADSEAMKRFQREAETVAGLHHTNIVPIFAIGCENGVNYYAMQFIEGQSLNLTVTRSPSATEIATWGLQAAEALAHAHQRGVIHRDIKPSNLILDPDGRIWLTDFGLAKRMDDVSLSLAGAIVGTPRYMSPEQASAAKNPVDHRTDIYSLGATLYELATGRPLFEADSPQAVITQILTTEPAAPRVICPDLPRDLETIILKCLAKEPERRYATAQSLADDLRAFVEGRAIRARRATLVEQAARWFKQQKRSVGVAAITVATTIMVIVGGTIAWQMREQSRLGYLTFNTPRDESERSEFAEILRAGSEEPVGSPFTLPTKEPVALPEGEYRLRLSSPSKLSQDYLFDVTAGQQTTFEVGLVNETVGLALPLKSPAGVELSGPSPISGQSEPRLLIGPQDQNKPTMRCIAATSQPGWKSDGTRESEVVPLWQADWRLEAPGILSFLKLPDDAGARQTLEFQRDVDAWQQLIAWFDPVWWRSGTPPKVMQPMSDLDGDGVEDAIWVAPRFANPFGSQFGPGPLTPKAPVLIAVSGKDGQPIWWFRPQDAKESACRLISDPIFVGSVAVMALRSTETGEVWVEGMESKSAQSLWRSKPLFVVPQSSVWLVPTTLTDGADGVIVTGGTRMFVLEARTGIVRPNPVATAAVNADNANRLTLQDNEPILDARFADFDGNGSVEAILTVQLSGRGLRDLAVSVTEAKTLWDVPSSFEVGAFHQNEARHTWPLLMDLDEDGKLEVILPGEREQGSSVSDGCRVLDAITGQPRWTRRIPRPGGFSHRTPEQITVGPDVDSDGHREVVMISVRNEQEPRFVGTSRNYRSGYAMYVDCFSGRSGQSLWWQRIPFGGSELSTWTGTPGEPLWWGGRRSREKPASMASHQGTIGPEFGDGSLVDEILLVIPVRRHADHGGDGIGNAAARQMFVLNAASGRVEHAAENMTHPQLVDWNNDGLEDLAVFVPDDPRQFDRQNWYPDQPNGKWVVLRGSPREAYRRLDQWTEQQDFDGDGIAELSRANGGRGVEYAVQIASGRDGRLIATWPTRWPETPRSWTVGELHSFPAPLGDFDGNGRSDLLLTRVGHFWDYADELRTIIKKREVPLLMQAISSQHGRRIWGGPLIPIPDAFLPNSRDESSNEWQAARQNRVSIQTVEAVELEGDGQPDLLANLVFSGYRPPTPGTTANIDLRQQFIALIDARSGKLRWTEPIAELLKGNGAWQSHGVLPRIEATSDLNGDSVRDIIVVLPQPGSDSWSYTFHARSGRDGKPLWGPITSGSWSHSDRLILPKVGDLDGDGHPELVLLESRQPMVVKVLRGETGEELWKWNGAVPPKFAEPSVVIIQTDRHAARDDSKTSNDTDATKDANSKTQDSARGTGRQQSVAVTINETGKQWELVLLDHAGQVVERIPYGTNQIWSHDLDGDGGHELLRFEGTTLTASRGLHEVLWKWTPPQRQYGWVSRFDESAEGRSIVATTVGDSLILLDGATGKPIARSWKSTNTSLQVNGRFVDTSHAHVASPFENSRLLTRVGDGSVMLNHMVSRAILPTDDEGRYETLNIGRNRGSSEARTSGAVGSDSRRVSGDNIGRSVANDPRLILSLPWVPSPGEWIRRRGDFFGQAVLAICLAIGLVVIPFWLIRAGVRRKQIDWWRAAWIAAGPAVCATTLMVFYVATSGSTWRGLPLLAVVSIGVSALPGLMWITTLLRNLFAGEWRRVSWLLGGSLFASFALAMFVLWRNASQKLPEQHYSWQGWWLILLIGAQMVGVLLVVWKVIGPGVLWLWYRFRKPRTQ